MIAAVVLAAGGSSRLGGRPKQLLAVDGVPLLVRVLTAVCRSAVAETIVVTGYRGEEVKAAGAGFGARFLDNPDWPRGMSTSLKAGLAGVDQEAAGVLVILADQPYLSPVLIDRLIDAFYTAPAPAIVRPAARSPNGRKVPGHPVLFARRYFPALYDARGDWGGREVLAAFPAQVVTVPADPRELMDVDTWDDLARCGPRDR